MPDDSSISNAGLAAVAASRELGEAGEATAAHFLRRSGYLIVLANFKVPIGRNRVGVQVSGEIDLIALDEGTLCFIEVKTRRSDDFAGPLVAIDLRKQRQIIRAARIYRRIFNIQDIPFRYDAVSIVQREGGRPAVELIKGYWTESKFKKKWWGDEF